MILQNWTDSCLPPSSGKQEKVNFVTPFRSINMNNGFGVITVK